MTNEVGYVTAARMREGRPVVDVTFSRPGANARDVPYLQPMSGLIVVPREGQKVLVSRTDDGRRVAWFPVNPATLEVPVLSEGDMLFKFSDDTELSFIQNTNDEYEVVLEAGAKLTVKNHGDLVIENSGDANVTVLGDVNITAENVSVEAAGEVSIDGAAGVRHGSGNSRVAREGDLVETWDPLTGTQYGRITSGSNYSTTD